jgi:hypothetical protein
MEKTRSLQSLMQAARAFQESRVLLSALELDMFAKTTTALSSNAVPEPWYRCVPIHHGNQ